MDKNNKPKFDKRFKMYKPKNIQEMNEFGIEDITELCEATEDYMYEDAAGKSLKKKAEKSGMPTGILRQVYNRGVAAWKGGHRPGTTPEQWGHARVNSFITKSSGTWGKADKDLAQKVRKEEVEMDEAHDPKHVKMAVGIASDKRYAGGNMTGAVKQIDKIKKGLSNHPQVRAVLRKQNEELINKLEEAVMSNQLDELTAAEKKLVNQMYDKKGNLTPLGKKVMNHGKKKGDKGFVESLDDRFEAFMAESKEEAEQLDELSPETLKSYKKKAMKQYTQSANKRNPGGGNYGSATKAAQDKHQKRFDKRHKGIGSEIKRTTDSDIHLKDPKGLVRKDPKSNSMTGKPAPYKNRAESKVDEVLDTPKAMDSYHNKAKAQSDRARNSATAKLVRGGKEKDISKEKNTIRKREKGMDMAQNVRAKQFRKSIGRGYGESLDINAKFEENFVQQQEESNLAFTIKGKLGEAFKEEKNKIREELKALKTNLDKIEGSCGSGAGEEGTPELVKKFKKDTPNA
jgi:hypothetical protein